MQLGRVAEHLQRRCGQLRLEADPGVKRAAHQLKGLGDDAAEIDGDALAALAAAISEDLVDQAARPVRRGENVLRVALEGRARGGLLDEHLGVAQDASEDVVEVVRDAAGEAADRLHLLRLPQPLLEPRALGVGKLALGDVAEVHHQRAHARLLEQVADGVLDPAPRPVLVAHHRLDRHHLPRRMHHLGAPAPRRLHMIRVKQLIGLAFAQVLDGVTEHALKAGAGVENAGLGASQDHAVGAVLDHRAELPLLALQRALAPGEPPCRERDQGQHGGRREHGPQEDARGLAVPRGEHRSLGRADEHLQRKAAHGDRRHEHALVQDRAGRPPGEAAFTFDRSGDVRIRKLASARLARIGNPRDDGAIASAKVDEASFAYVDHAVEPVEILDLHHRRNDAAECAVGRVEAPRHDETPFRAIATALVRLAEEKPCIACLAVRCEERAPGEAVIDRRGLVGAPHDAPVCVDHQEAGDLRNMDHFVAQARHHGRHFRRGPVAHRIAQHQVDGLQGGRGLLRKQPAEVGQIAPRAQLRAVAVGSRIPDGGSDVDADQHGAERDERAGQGDAGGGRSGRSRRHCSAIGPAGRRARPPPGSARGA